MVSTMGANPLRAPFSYFGGKSRIADEVWQRLGDCPNYVEPFFGSGAVLLARPGEPGVETANDLDGMISNFWRAVQSDPDEVAWWADYPVIERDLEARHYWLVSEGRRRIAPMAGDPSVYDAQVAGWWVWGISTWIGGGWCSGNGPHAWDGERWALRDGGPCGVDKRLPSLPASGGNGVHAGVVRQRPAIGDGHGRGVHSTQMVIVDRLRALANRLRRVRVCCGDWSRICSPTVTTGVGLTGVFLDPPYSAEAGRAAAIYARDCGEVAHRAHDWAVAQGDDPQMRIAFCGYDTEHVFPENWECFEWKATGGYGNRTPDGQGRVNAERERIWFSPHCQRPARQLSLFEVPRCGWYDDGDGES
jgi:hypothetical protein